jgi:segregation and condensation protein B
MFPKCGPKNKMAKKFTCFKFLPFNSKICLMNQELTAKLEAILFWKAEPVTIKKLAQLLSITEDQIKTAIVELEASLKTRGSGLTIIQTDAEVMLGTVKELSPLIGQLTKEELTRDLGKAGLETLAIILYQGPISRADIDYIRGVNSQFILRNLLIRGLVERVDNPKDARSFLYKTTLDLLAHLGVSKIEELPEYEKVRADIEAFKGTQTDATISA